MQQLDTIKITICKTKKMNKMMRVNAMMVARIC